MNIEKIEKIEYDAYDKIINISLFNKIIAFISRTRISKDTREILQEIEKRCIWFGTEEGDTIKEEYKFQYLGELLERYEERFGNAIRDTRAIALALGYGKKLIENSMTVGTQLVDFISKVSRLAENDIYLKGALYLYNNEKYHMYSEEFMARKYTNTIDIIFALSLFYERSDDFLRQNKQQIIELVGKSKNISVMGNIGLYAWLIKVLYLLVSKDRKKETVLLRALIKLPTGCQNEDTTVYKVLIDNGYSKEEIAYLNYLMIYYKAVPKTVRTGYSIIEEKIAVNFCLTLINSEKSYENYIYDLIKKVLYKYSEFKIKCYGAYGIKAVIEKKLNISNPITFAELYGVINNNLYSFNILDKNWDVVANRADSKKYEEIFDNFLLFSRYDTEKIKKCINRYNELTQREYLESFLQYNYNRKSIFETLVERNVIFLKDIFSASLDKIEKNEDSHLKKYINGVYNKKSFEFLKYLLRLNKYNIIEISEFGFEFERLIDGYFYSNYPIYHLDIKRKFLTQKDSMILFECLEKYAFYKQPKKYFGFLKVVLESDTVSKFFQKSDLRSLYSSLCEIKPEIYKKEYLQEKYLTFEEIEAIREQKRIEKERKEKEELKELKNSLQHEFEKTIEKKKIEALCKFCDNYEYNDKKIRICMELVKHYIKQNINIFSKESNEIKYLMILLEFLIEKEALNFNEFVEIIYGYIKEEVKRNESINATCQYNN